MDNQTAFNGHDNKTILRYLMPDSNGLSKTKNIWSLVGKTVSVHIPETPLLKRDKFGRYNMEQFQKDCSTGSRSQEIYDEEEVIIEQILHFKVKYLKHLPLNTFGHIIWVFPNCEVEVDFMSNKDYYKGQDLFVDCVSLIGIETDSTYAELCTTRDACNYTYTIGCDFLVEGNLLCSREEKSLLSV